MGRLNFEALKNLQNSANDLLQSPEIQEALVDRRRDKTVHEVSEASLRMLDRCGASKDILMHVKRHLRDLKFTFRRATAEEFADIGSEIFACNVYRKKLKKETLACLNSLKAIKGKPAGSGQGLGVVVDVLREVRITTISIVESLLSLIEKPWVERKPGNYKRAVRFGSRFKRVSERSLYDIRDEMEIESANKRLEAVEITIECIEVELECIFRRLIETRVSLLNILTN